MPWFVQNLNIELVIAGANCTSLKCNFQDGWKIVSFFVYLTLSIQMKIVNSGNSSKSLHTEEAILSNYNNEIWRTLSISKFRLWTVSGENNLLVRANQYVRRWERLNWCQVLCITFNTLLVKFEENEKLNFLSEFENLSLSVNYC